MKLIRFGEPGREKPGVLTQDGQVRIDASSFADDWDSEFFATDGLDRIARWRVVNPPLVPASVRLGPPVARPGKIVCIGLNFRDHAHETGAKVPEEPVIFMKATSALAGPNDDVIIPRDSTKTDWEVELAVVIGKRASYVSEAEAMNHVAGYVLHNDYSERAFQLERGGQWVKGKSCDTFAPLGPFLVTKDEIPNPDNLRMWLKVNGRMRQDSSTSNMIFKVPKLVSYVSQFMSLMPGDIISTGTPAGVALGHNPPEYLRPGDEVELGIDGLGSSRQRLCACE